MGNQMKTLKDLEKKYEWNYTTLQSLRKEAIKWIKELSEPDHILVKNHGLAIDGINYGNYFELKKVKQWIMYFFNIKEEELK